MSQEEIDVEVLTTKHLKRISDRHRFSLFAAGCFGCICASMGYAFNLVSGDMQKLKNMTQIDIANVNTVATVLQYATFPYCVLYDYIGPIPVSIISGVLFGLGSLLLALTFSRTITPSVVRICVFNGIMSSACMIFDLVSNVTVVAHFPTSRGLTIALLKSYVGIGSSIIATIRLAYFVNPIHFFYFLFALSVATAIVLAGVLRLPPYHLTGYQEKHLSIEEKEKRVAYKAQYLRQKVPKWGQIYVFVLLLVSIAYLLIASALTNYLHLGHTYKSAFAIVAIILTLLILVLCLPLYRCGSSSEKEDQDEEAFEERQYDAIEPVEDDIAIQAKESTVAANHKETNIDYIAPQYQTTFVQSLVTLRFWAIIWTLFCLSGTEFTVIFYSSYIYGAIAGEKTSNDMRTLLSVLNGAGSAIGRLIIALFEHLTQNRPPEKRIPVTWAPMIPSTFMTLALVLFLCLPPKALPLAFVILALANGSQAAMTALVPRTIYAKDAAKHYQFQFIACILSAIVLVRFLYAEWYARQAKRNHNPDGYCFGKGCIIMPFCVQLGLIVSTYASNLYVCWRYSQYSKKVLAERRKIVGEAQSSVEADDVPKEEGGVVGETVPFSLEELKDEIELDKEIENERRTPKN